MCKCGDQNSHCCFFVGFLCFCGEIILRHDEWRPLMAVTAVTFSHSFVTVRYAVPIRALHCHLPHSSLPLLYRMSQHNIWSVSIQYLLCVAVWLSPKIQIDSPSTMMFPLHCKDCPKACSQSFCCCFSCKYPEQLADE